MVRKRKKFRIFSMLLSTLFSNCTCSYAKRYQVNKIKRINKKKVGHLIKRKFDIKKFKKNKSNLLPNALKIAGALVGATGFGLLVKEYLGKKNEVGETKDEIKKIQYEVKLSKADEEYIRKNFFICRWPPGRNLCWNNTFIQYLMCPDIRCKSVCSSRIMKVLNWINNKMKKKHTRPFFTRVIDVPNDVRPMVEYEGGCCHARNQGGDYCKFTNWLKCSKFHSAIELFCCDYKRDIHEDNIGKYYTDINGKVIDHEKFLRDQGVESSRKAINDMLEYSFAIETCEKNNINEYVSLVDMGIHKLFVSAFPKSKKSNKGKNTPSGYEEFLITNFSDFQNFIKFTDSKLNVYDNYLICACDKDLQDRDGNNFFNSAPKGYYPTFVSFLDTKSRDYKSCYLIYDNNKEIKFVIYIDTLCDEMKVISLQTMMEIIGNNEWAFIRYSRSDIVERYYVPTKQKER